ncbi:MAG: major capsid protein [Candidatus Scalindua sp.]
MATRDITSRESLVTAARQTANGMITNVAEVLNETLNLIEDAIVQKSTDITSHRVTRRSRLPAISWVKVGNGWNATVGLTNQAVETIGMMKARFSAPQDVMDIQANPDKYRSNQERTYIEAMGQKLEKTLFGKTSAGDLSPTTAPPEEFAGFQYRLNALSTDPTKYVISNGHTADDNTNTSIWFIQWSPTKVYLITPRNMDGGGLKKEDKGLQLVSGDNAAVSTATPPVYPNPTNQLWAYITEFSWNVGLAIEDQRAVKRLCNIDPDLTADDTLDEDKIIQIRNNFRGNEKIYMYCNETVFTQLQILAKDKTNVHWTGDDPFGRPQFNFLDMPVRRSDAISDVEPVIS